MFPGLAAKKRKRRRTGLILRTLFAAKIFGSGSATPVRSAEFDHGFPGFHGWGKNVKAEGQVPPGTTENSPAIHCWGQGVLPQGQPAPTKNRRRDAAATRRRDAHATGRCTVPVLMFPGLAAKKRKRRRTGLILRTLFAAKIFGSGSATPVRSAEFDHGFPGFHGWGKNVKAEGQVPPGTTENSPAIHCWGQGVLPHGHLHQPRTVGETPP